MESHKNIGDIIPCSIDEFRTWRYRVFSAPPYFNVNLEYEIKWHEKYIKDLHRQKKNPSRFHTKRTNHKISHDHLRHFKEHVIEAIPFHRSILEKHKQRLHTIQKFMPLKKYRKLVGICLKFGGTPEYFVFDKLKKELFFVAESTNEEKHRWATKTKKLVDIIVLEEKDIV